MNSLTKLVERVRGRRVVVLGDFVADLFVYGEIARISREAPVLVLNHRETQLVPGGGANAVHNIHALGARPIPVGVVGDDAEGQQLLQYFLNLGIEIGGIRVLKDYRTPTKTRILAGAVHAQRQQIVRLDAGGFSNGKPDSRATELLEHKLKSALRQADAVLVSDYGYGVIDPNLAAKARVNGIPATIDSRFQLTSFTGMTAATPNEP